MSNEVKRELELSIKCHIYIPLNEEGDADSKRELLERLLDNHGLEYQIHEALIQEL